MRVVLYNLFVNGVPKPQPRHRTARNGHVYTPHSADLWKQQINDVFKPCLKSMITAPVCLRVSFFLPIPKTVEKDMENEGVSCVPHAKKPDNDNLLKAVMDQLTRLGVWKDDAQVYANDTSKWYCKGKLGAQIIIETKSVEKN
jgi:Holliday junction resolvase RusA-like endonuclease